MEQGEAVKYWLLIELMDFEFLLHDESTLHLLG
jgi:hypothetical protein